MRVKQDRSGTKSKGSGIHTGSEHLLSHFADINSQDKWKLLILLWNSILEVVHKIQQLLEKRKSRQDL